ncbi:MAG: DNA polymerase III subunit alpha [Gammaproteobacteria bacterium RIFCSPHIGHO2_12_FULL_45_12]|nr:MAG: DNA polymerase III subunit alpha [Gammaproteobacteria bacterium RIFCSPHIGHO2_12_FULL_45_12]
MEPTFVHLRLHTEFSLSDGLLPIDTLMKFARESGMPALAITDLGNLYATIKFYKAALAHGIKPIIGVDLTVIDPKQPKTSGRLTLLCQNNQGYQNLLTLVSKSFLEGQQGHQKPTIQAAWLGEGLSNGLIALSGGMEGDIGQALLAQDQEAARTYLRQWCALFPNRFYMEVCRVGKAHEKEYNNAAISLACQQNIPIVATNDVRFLKREDFEAHEARVCIQEGITLNDPRRARLYTEQQFLCSPTDMAKRFADIPQALTHSVEIAKRCNVSFTLGKSFLPHFPIPANHSTESFICEVAMQGLNDRLTALHDTHAADFAAKREPYDLRLKQELDVINNMGFAGYFLIVADFTKWAKENGIPVGPGRGSGPGSLVAYALKITDLDPLALKLLFERFLNPERVSMPDFDIDFCMEGRDRVIDYVMEKHGHDSVSQIITYGTMAAKAVVRDVGRVLGLGYGFVDKIAKLIPFELGITLQKAMAQEPLLKERYQQEDEVRTLIDLALKLEGLTRNVGKHAGGIVIAPGKLTDYVPLYCEVNEPEHPVTQFDKDDVEAVGLVKFDFLGLKTLTIIDRALRIVNPLQASPIDISLIPLNDPPTFSLLKACQSTAVFQLESHGMRDLIKRIQPDCFEDLIALVALFRPGPLQSGMVDDFINRKHGRAKVIYPHPKLEPILAPTYGVILYQEQVMQIAQVLAGYTLGAADILRRAMGKKKPEEMAKQRQIFCEGATSRGVAPDVATYIFDLMEKFAGYGFNKSHSAAYALIAYQTAWLKTHHTAAFMAATLSSDMDKTDKIMTLLTDCRAMKLEVAPPDINKSLYFFTVINTQHLMYGLGAIKGVGEAAIENIVEVRQQGTPFRDIFDFCQRIDLRKSNRRVLEALIKAGCFDLLEKNRAMLMASLNSAIQHAEQALHNQTYGQHDLLALMADQTGIPPYVTTAPWNEETQLKGEKDSLGFYLTGHPMNRYLKELAHFTTCRIGHLQRRQHTSTRISGIVTHIRLRQTKRGDRIAIFSLDDGQARIEVVCFSECFHQYRELIIEDRMIIVEGDIGIDDFSNSTRLMAKDLFTLETARERFAKYLKITLPDNQPFDMQRLKQILDKHLNGTCQVVLHYLLENAQAQLKLGEAFKIHPSELLLSSLKELFPDEEVEFIY